jgi:hypothetical protein
MVQQSILIEFCTTISMPDGALLGPMGPKTEKSQNSTDRIEFGNGNGRLIAPALMRHFAKASATMKTKERCKSSCPIELLYYAWNAVHATLEH